MSTQPNGAWLKFSRRLIDDENQLKMALNEADIPKADGNFAPSQIAGKLAPSTTR